FYPELAAFLDRVMARLPGVEVVLVPMEGDLDRAAAEELASHIARAAGGCPGAGTASGGEEAAGAGASSRVATASGTGEAAVAVAVSGRGRGEPVPPGARRPRVHVLSTHDDPADLEALVAGSWLAVGMRLHFLLFAARAGVPVLALNYDPKVAGAMARLGMSRYVFELDRVRAADLLSALEELVARYDEVSRTLREAAAGLAPLAAANLDYVDAAVARTLGPS
ncbi:MAG TPA: polysaccharide pyruvyl transferase family protein, partial [Thermaerobacter sp.]